MKTAKIDLHLHLDGSLNLPWAYKTALKRGVVAPDTTFEQYYAEMMRTKFENREQRMKRFDFPIAILQTKEDLQEATYLLLQTLNCQEMLYAEIRFAPQQHTSGGLSQKEATLAVLAGINQAKADFPNLEARLINCCMHKGDHASFNETLNMETIEVSKELLGQGVVAVDLAGYENTGPFTAYAPLFEKARALGIPYTIHAGEMGLGEHVGEAIAMQAHRIGHGVNCVQNKTWLQEVVDTQIPLEVCLSSNIAEERNVANHPIRQLLQAGAKVTINTDNMTFSRTWLQNEHELLKTVGVTEEQLIQCTYNALEAAFCDEATKQKLKTELDRQFNR